jgi:hypothetical protein
MLRKALFDAVFEDLAEFVILLRYGSVFLG